MEQYGGTGKGHFIMGQGFYMENLLKAIEDNSLWLPDTRLYRKHIYDPEQVEEEERIEKEQKQQEMQRQNQIEQEKGSLKPTTLDTGPKELDIKETKDNSEKSGFQHNLNESIWKLLQELDKYFFNRKRMQPGC